MGSKKFLVKKMLSQNFFKSYKILDKKFFWVKTISVKQIFCQKKFYCQRLFLIQNKFLNKKNMGQVTFLVEKCNKMKTYFHKQAKFLFVNFFWLKKSLTTMSNSNASCFSVALS